MDKDLLVGIEALLVFGIVVGFGVWQLISVRRDQRRADEAERRDERPG
jgi:hypothetical protein